jgi:hypothetical protein
MATVCAAGGGWREANKLTELEVRVLSLALVAVAAVVLRHREAITQWLREAIGRGDTTEKALALDLGRDLGHLSRIITNGTLHAADLLALPAPVRDLVLERMTSQAGLITVRQALREAAERQERAILAALTPNSLALRCVESRPVHREVA